MTTPRSNAKTRKQLKTRRQWKRATFTEIAGAGTWTFWNTPLSDVLENARPADLEAEIRARVGKRPVRVLEVGCGTGRALAELEKRFGNQIRVRGTNLAGARVPSLALDAKKIVRTPAERLTDKIRPNSIDVLLDHSAAVTHAVQPLKPIQEYAKALAPGGTAVIVVPNARPFARSRGFRKANWLDPDAAERGLQRVVRPHGVRAAVFPRADKAFRGWLIQLHKNKER